MRQLIGPRAIVLEAHPQPGAGVSPHAVSCSARHSQKLGGFVQRKPAEIVELNQFRGLGIFN